MDCLLSFCRVRKRKIGNSTSPSSSSANNDQESQHSGESQPNLVKSSQLRNVGESQSSQIKSSKRQIVGESHLLTTFTSTPSDQNFAKVLLDKTLAKELPLQITPVKPG